MADYTAKEFSRLLAYGTAEDQRSAAFARAGSALERRFALTGSSIRNSVRVDFRNYIDYLRVTLGLSAAFDRLEELRLSGLSPELYATSGMISARRANDYSAAVSHLEKAHDLWPTSPIIQEFLVESWISVGSLDTPSGLLGELNPATEREAVRFAELAALILEWDIATRLLGTWGGTDPAFAIKVLKERIRLSAQFSGQSGEVPAYVLNLPSDERKLGLATRLYGRLGINAMQHPGIDASSLSPEERSDAARHTQLRIGVGALGCALGHFSMWNQFLAGSSTFALMLEDDGLPFSQRDVGPLIDEAGDFDVLFVNKRMSGVKWESIQSGFLPVWDVLARRPDSGGWGADGYILSRNGAEKLLEAVETDGVLGHVDGQLAAYGIDSAAEAVSNAQRIGRSMRDKSVAQPVLNIKCSAFPLVASSDFGDSTIGRMGGHKG